MKKPADYLKLTVINNADFTETVSSAEIDLIAYKNLIIMVKAGAKTDSPTMDVKFQIRDSNNNWYDHTTFTQITDASKAIKEISNLSARYGKIVCTYGGTGKLAATTVELQAKR